MSLISAVIVSDGVCNTTVELRAELSLVYTYPGKASLVAVSPEFDRIPLI